MAAARETDATLVKPLEGAVVRRFTAGSAIEAGESVYMASDGAIDPTNGGAVATSMSIGIATGPTDYAAGDRVPVVTYGPVLCMAGATIGAFIYVSDTAGELLETAGTKDTIIGWAESATTLFVRPQIIDFA